MLGLLTGAAAETLLSSVGEGAMLTVSVYLASKK